MEGWTRSRQVRASSIPAASESGGETTGMVLG